MTRPHQTIQTLAHIQEALKADVSLDPHVRSELSSAVTRFCEICGVDPSQVLADPIAIRQLRKAASWQIAGLKERSWANIVTRLTRAMSLMGVDVDRRCRKTQLLPIWEDLLGGLSRNHWKRLRRLAGWCSARQIAPAEVTEATFAAFYEFLHTQSVQSNLRERWHEARRAWNKVVAIPGSTYPTIPNLAPPRWRSMQWDAFPGSLQEALAAWRHYLASPTLFDERDPLRPVTIRNYDLALRRYASRLVETGAEPGEIASLTDLLDVARVKQGLQPIKGEDNSDQARGRLHVVLHALLSVARFVELSPSHPGFEHQQREFAFLRKLAAKARVPQFGMVRKNRDRLAKLSNATAARLFRNLHATIAALYEGIKEPTITQAQEMQKAAILVLLLDLPLRIKNVAALDLDRHISRPPGGQSGPWRIAIAGEEMKNHQPFEAQLGEEASAFLSDYVGRFRPALLKGPSSILFVSRTGLAKKTTTLSTQFSAFIRRELGLQVNPHLLRHHAGMLWLNNMPGEYQPLSKLLGHSSSRTTELSYTGAESKTAQDRYHSLLDTLRAQDRTAASRSDVEARRRRQGASA